jgi:hypothetical protein
MNAVISAFHAIELKIKETNMYDAFWNVHYEGHKIISKTPKNETEIQPIIHMLICDVATAKNLKIYPETQIGTGNIDFFISGTLKSGEIAGVCVEVKFAHHVKLIDGLIKQLPYYMQRKGCDNGIFYIISFKGKNFSRPTEYDFDKLQYELRMILLKEGLLDKIDVITLDVAHPTPPSKL